MWPHHCPSNPPTSLIPPSSSLSQRLVRTLGRSLGAVGNLGALLFLLFFIIGVLSVEIYANLCSDDGFTDGPQGMKIDRCMLVEESKLMSKHATFEDIGMSFLTLFRIATGDNWSEVMNSCQLEPGPRRSGDAAVRTAISYIKEYIATGSYTYLEMARSELPACQTLEELEAMKEVVTCRYPDEFGSCPSTCGVKIISNLLFSAFLCASNFILLNLVMAVLMQELQAAIVEPEVKANMAVASLVAMSKATSKMTQKLNNAQRGGVAREVTGTARWRIALPRGTRGVQPS